MNCRGKTRNKAEGFCVTSAAEQVPPPPAPFLNTVLFFYILSRDLAAAQLTYRPRSDYWAVQMDDPKEDHNQKENRGKENPESWERQS